MHSAFESAGRSSIYLEAPKGRSNRRPDGCARTLHGLYAPSLRGAPFTRGVLDGPQTGCVKAACRGAARGNRAHSPPVSTTPRLYTTAPFTPLRTQMHVHLRGSAPLTQLYVATTVISHVMQPFSTTTMLNSKQILLANRTFKNTNTCAKNKFQNYSNTSSDTPFTMFSIKI